MYLYVEIPGGGQLFPNYDIKTFRLNLYVSGLDYFRMALEIICLLIILYNIFDEGRELYHAIKRHRIKKYFFNFWNILEIVDLVLYVVVIGLYIDYIAAPGRYGIDLSIRYYFPEMEQIAATALNFYNVSAVNVLISTFRTFKYLRLNNRLYVLWKALTYAGADLIGFLLIFLIITFGFIFMGWLAFGADLTAYDGFTNSFATCWNFLLGNPPDYFAMQSSNRVLGPLFFTLFTIFIFFILANMFIAILSNSFNVVSGDQGKIDVLDAISERVESIVKSITKTYEKMKKRPPRPKRAIKVLLDELAHPEILDQGDLTRDDVSRAIGPDAIEDEIEDLYVWVKKLESKKSRKAAKELKEASHPIIMDEHDDFGGHLAGADEADSNRSVDKGSASSTIGKKGLAFRRTNTEYNEIKDSMLNLQTQVADMQRLLNLLVTNNANRTSSNNNNNF